MLSDVFWANVVGRVRGPCCEMCSDTILSDVSGAYVVGRVRGLCCGTGRDPCCGRCSGLSPSRHDSDPRQLLLVQLILNVIIVCKRVYGLMLVPS